MTKQLYKVSQATGKELQWRSWSEGELVFTEYGQFGGKLQVKSYTAEATNVGRSNERNPEAQAKEEVLKLYIAQVKNKHYREDLKESWEMYNDCKIPRKVYNYKDHGHKMSDTLYSSVKKDGTRLESIQGYCYSKAGLVEEVKVKHLREALDKLRHWDLDSEVYKHGMSLQRIRACFTKPVRTPKEVEKQRTKFKKDFGMEMPYDSNEDAKSLELHVFDIPVKGLMFKDRIRLLEQLNEDIVLLGLEQVVKVIFPVLTHSAEERLALRDKVVSEGFEGLVHYEPEDEVYFGTRALSTQKDKPRYDSEAYCYGVEKCKNGDGKLLLRASDKFFNVEFKCMMKVKRRDGKEYPRDFETMQGMVGKWVTYSYEDLSDRGVPTKPVGELERKCDETGEPLE